MSTLRSGDYVQQCRVIRLLGAGGMGAVYEAMDESLGTRVAVKVLHAEYAQQPESLARFFNEARAVQQIGHEGTVQIFECGFTSDGSAFLIMELLRGETLADRLQRRGGRLSIEEACALGAQIADVLAAAHRRGVIHRDLKPDNVMILSPDTSSQRIKLLDFGIAKLTRGDGARYTCEADDLIGTPAYMSPEQCRGASEVGARSDCYALGILMYVMLTGRLPINGMSAAEIMARQIFAPPTPIAMLMSNLPVDLARLVEDLLAKESSLRPDMTTIAEALRQLRARRRADRSIVRTRRGNFTAALCAAILTLLSVRCWERLSDEAGSASQALTSSLSAVKRTRKPACGPEDCAMTVAYTAPLGPPSLAASSSLMLQEALGLRRRLGGSAGAG